MYGAHHAAPGVPSPSPSRRDVAPGGTRSAAVVADHSQKVCLALGLHPEGEDAVLWLLLWERGAEQAAAIGPSMEEHHHCIEAALHDVNALVPAWQSTAQDGENLAAAIDALLDRLQEHIALKEKEILPLAEKFVTAAEWARLG
ncbi:MAG: hemerythrin domain-containing protein [Streptosporangiaceae bacterium]